MKNFSICWDVSKTKPMRFQSLRTHILVFHQLKKIFILFNKFYFLENVLMDFEKCEWGAAFLDSSSCTSDNRNNQIQNKLIKN